MSDRKAVYSAIAKVMADLAKAGIAKNNKNAQQGYKFRGIDDIYNALSKSLADNKLCILPRVIDREVTERKTKNGGVLFYTTITVEFDMVSAEDGSMHTVCTVGEAMDAADKSSNKAMSAAYKYACLQAFCIPTEGDNDADAQTHEVAPVEQHKPQPKAQSRETYTRLETAIRSQKTLSDLERWLIVPSVMAAYDEQPKDWKASLDAEVNAKREQLKANEMPESKPQDDKPQEESFPGDI